MTDEIWTVKRILEWIEEYLAQHGDEKPSASARWLVAEALGISKMQLFLDLERPLTQDERAVLRDYTRRRGTGEPLQYITGTVDFRHITVKIRPGTLIPRPETEVLVSEALALLPAAEKPQNAFDDELIKQYAKLSEADTIVEKPHVRESASDETEEAKETQVNPLKNTSLSQLAHDADNPPNEPSDKELLVADICTGSGCIACSIAYEHPRTRVIATDISPTAVALARENVGDLKLNERVEVIECDLGSGVDPAIIGAFDLIVSNPPYIPTNTLAEIPREVTDFEPSLALDGGPDGLDAYRRLLSWCANALKPGGALAFELHETRVDQAAIEAEAAGFADVRIHRDLSNRPRILTGRKLSISAIPR